MNKKSGKRYLDVNGAPIILNQLHLHWSTFCTVHMMKHLKSERPGTIMAHKAPGDRVKRRSDQFFVFIVFNYTKHFVFSLQLTQRKQQLNRKRANIQHRPGIVVTRVPNVPQNSHTLNSHKTPTSLAPATRLVLNIWKTSL